MDGRRGKKPRSNRTYSKSKRTSKKTTTSSADPVEARYRQMGLAELAMVERMLLGVGMIGRVGQKTTLSDEGKREMLRDGEDAEESLRILRKVMKEKEDEKFSW